MIGDDRPEWVFDVVKKNHIIFSRSFMSVTTQSQFSEIKMT